MFCSENVGAEESVVERICQCGLRELALIIPSPELLISIIITLSSLPLSFSFLLVFPSCLSVLVFRSGDEEEEVVDEEIALMGDFPGDESRDGEWEGEGWLRERIQAEESRSEGSSSSENR